MGGAEIKGKAGAATGWVGMSCDQGRDVEDG